jgi:DNA-binding YbaB/EbfC family protein
VTGSAGGGAVTCEATGLQEVRRITIAPEAVDPDDLSVLEDLVLLAVQDALSKAKELAAQRMGELTGGLRLPGLF